MHQNSLFKEVLQAYVWRSVEFIEKCADIAISNNIANISDITIWVKYVLGFSEFCHPVQSYVPKSGFVYLLLSVRHRESDFLS